MAAAVQRIAIEAERHRFTFRQTRRTVPITFSMMLVQASKRHPLLRQSKPRDGEDLIDAFQDRARDPGPVSFETLGKVRSSFSALSASSNSQACRNTRRTEACSDLGNRSIMLRALWT